MLQNYHGDGQHCPGFPQECSLFDFDFYGTPALRQQVNPSFTSFKLKHTPGFHSIAY